MCLPMPPALQTGTVWTGWSWGWDGRGMEGDRVVFPSGCLTSVSFITCPCPSLLSSIQIWLDGCLTCLVPAPTHPCFFFLVFGPCPTCTPSPPFPSTHLQPHHHPSTPNPHTTCHPPSPTISFPFVTATPNKHFLHRTPAPVLWDPFSPLPLYTLPPLTPRRWWVWCVLWVDMLCVFSLYLFGGSAGVNSVIGSCGLPSCCWTSPLYPTHFLPHATPPHALSHKKNFHPHSSLQPHLYHACCLLHPCMPTTPTCTHTHTHPKILSPPAGHGMACPPQAGTDQATTTTPFPSLPTHPPHLPPPLPLPSGIIIMINSVDSDCLWLPCHACLPPACLGMFILGRKHFLHGFGSGLHHPHCHAFGAFSLNLPLISSICFLHTCLACHLALPHTPAASHVSSLWFPKHALACVAAYGFCCAFHHKHEGGVGEVPGLWRLKQTVPHHHVLCGCVCLPTTTYLPTMCFLPVPSSCEAWWKENGRKALLLFSLLMFIFAFL